MWVCACVFSSVIGNRLINYEVLKLSMERRASPQKVPVLLLLQIEGVEGKESTYSHENGVRHGLIDQVLSKRDRGNRPYGLKTRVLSQAMMNAQPGEIDTTLDRPSPSLCCS